MAKRTTLKKMDEQHKEGHGRTRNNRSGCTGQKTMEESDVAPDMATCWKWETNIMTMMMMHV